MPLEPCPPSPNCVCSQEDPADSTHYIEPIRFTGDPSAAMEAVAAVIADTPRATVTTRTDRRVDAVFTSLIFRFKDDVSFLVDPADGVIHMRSASRVGHSDLGANRKRLDGLVPRIQARLQG